MKVRHNNFPYSNIEIFHDISGLEYIDISYNNISLSGYFQRQLFAVNKELRVIYLSSTSLAVIDQDAFKHLQSLQELDLSGNLLDSSLFLDMPSARYLNLQGNRVGFNGT